MTEKRSNHLQEVLPDWMQRQLVPKVLFNNFNDFHVLQEEHVVVKQTNDTTQVTFDCREEKLSKL